MHFRTLLLFVVFNTLVFGNETEPKVDPGFVAFRDRCMACHLQSGMGIREMNAPSIAGLPRWYISDQLRKFRRDERGFDDDDSSGNLMKANAAALDERSIAFLGRHIENLPPNPTRNTLKAPVLESGKQLYQQHCLECHGESAEGNRQERVPPLTSQQDWYLLRQMENFSSSKRIHFDSDKLSLSEKDMSDIIAWISSL